VKTIDDYGDFASVCGLNNGTNSNRRVCAITDTSGTMAWYDNTNGVVLSTTKMPKNTWNLVIASLTGTTLRVYLNTTAVISTTLGGTPPATGQDRMVLGTGTIGSTETIKGNISRIIFCNFAMTANDVADFYYDNLIKNNGVLATPLNEYNFTDGAGSTLTDSGSLLINGTLAAGATWSTDVPFTPRTVATARTLATARTAV